MELKKRIQEDIIKASKEGNDVVRSTLRFLVSEIGKKEIELNKRDEGLSEEEIQRIILTEIKKRKEAEVQYVEGDREDLAKDEREEAEILQAYAPEQKSEEELKELVNDIIKEVKATGPQDMGTVMKGVMAKAGNSADGSMVNKIVREALQNL